MKNLKIAFTGASGSGKTTLVKWVSETFNIPHISGSAGDVKTPADNRLLDDLFELDSDGHHGVIVNSAINPHYGVMNQKLLLMRRLEIFKYNDHFVTDRSTVDNMTYFINQCGFHPQVTKAMCDDFLNDCVRGIIELDLVIHIKSVQPNGDVENNGSRIPNHYYQQSIDTQFSHWLGVIRKHMDGSLTIHPTRFITIDYWDLDTRKKEIALAIQNIIQ